MYANPGKISNYYHVTFSNKTGINSLEEIAELESKYPDQAKLNIPEKTSGFHARNTLVAKSDYLIAFTRGQDIPTDGGTADTWKKCKSKNKVHFSLVLSDIAE